MSVQFGQITVQKFGPSTMRFESRPQANGEREYVSNPKTGQPLNHVKLTLTEEHLEQAHPFLDDAKDKPAKANLSFFITDGGGNCLVKVNRQRPRRLRSKEEILSAFKLIGEAPERKGFSHYQRLYFLFASYGGGLRERVAEVMDMWPTLDAICKRLDT